MVHAAIGGKENGPILQREGGARGNCFQINKKKGADFFGGNGRNFNDTSREESGCSSIFFITDKKRHKKRNRSHVPNVLTRERAGARSGLSKSTNSDTI